MAKNSRYCELMKLQSFRASGAMHPVSMEDLSAKKLLEASLVTLETMGRQQQSLRESQSAGGRTPSGSRYGSPQREHHHHSNSARDGYDSATTTAGTGGVGGGSHPTESYLGGAIWLAKNYSLLSDDLVQEVDEFRSKFLIEVARASEDADLRRSCNRLNLLAGSGVTQAMSMINRNRIRAREILKVIS